MSAIINPKTNRPVKIGGRIWLELVKEGLIEGGSYNDPKQLDDQPDNPEELKTRIQEINKTLPRGKQAVKGRGKYAGKIVERKSRPSTEDTARYTAQIASRAVSNNIEELAECDDIEGMLEKLIIEEMMDTRPKSKPPIVSRKNKECWVEEECEAEEEKIEEEEGDFEEIEDFEEYY